ncbi:sigma 54-interacting transcriptional regulator [Clostridium sp. D2Q-14]|uniref:sigma-54 interaction domain-containing protein n=1 Tax=Anaeromonas gelatinilytica TaxID=2683194 RepID=UPI00193BC022|nr:sigma 54-interacting transcriptional regulator [Anaeromonas gelatinilytica]MBS4534932.1 sigma 54-interacting transcriptional regulator [Anaeromonas gelatinilytica]
MKDIFFRENIFEILNYLEEGIQIIDEKGKILYFNKSVQNLDELDRDKTIGRHILEVYPSLSYDTSTLIRVMETGKPIYNAEQSFVNYKGDRITTVNTSIPIKEKGRIKGAIEISTDITNVKKLSEKIVDLQKELYKDKEKPRKNKEKARYTFVDIIGQNSSMIKLKAMALRASRTSSPVLIYGETGTGKELLVQSIHNASGRKNDHFIAQNCAALPANLLEGILFGTVKGGFTGAEDRPGLFELANGGTLFLDEINSMPLELQAKMLRVLQDGSIRRLGSTKTVDVDVRIITATNTEPDKAMEEKLIRKDLFYRLSVINLEIPPLRERIDDIPVLVEYFIDKYNEKLNTSVKDISNEALNVFNKYSWPGNVRELEHVIQGILSIEETDIIKEKHLPSQFVDFIEKSTVNKEEIQPLNKAVEELEKQIIFSGLNKTNWNITKTAELILVPRQTLQYKIKKYGLKEKK